MILLEGRRRIDDPDTFLEALQGDRDGLDVTVQAFDGRYVAGVRHLEQAISLADRAIARSENVARDRAVEILLYAAGRRQIDRALEMGVSPDTECVTVLVEGRDEGSTAEALESALGLESVTTVADESGGQQRLCEPDEGTIRAFFDVTEAETAATDATLEELVCERVALLDVHK